MDVGEGLLEFGLWGVCFCGRLDHRGANLPIKGRLLNVRGPVASCPWISYTRLINGPELLLICCMFIRPQIRFGPNAATWGAGALRKRHGCMCGSMFVQSCGCMFSVRMLAVSVNTDHAWEPAALSLPTPPLCFSLSISLECKML